MVTRTQTIEERSSPVHGRIGGLHALRRDMPEERASRIWLLGAFLLALASIIPEAFGRQVFDTKLDLITSPVSLLGHLTNLWDPNGWFGFLQDQYQGYAFPDAPFFALGHFLAIPPWLMQRSWMALLIAAAFWGVVRLAEALEIGSLPTRLVAGVAFAVWPTFTILVGSSSAAIAPGVLLPWVIIPLVKGCKGGSTLRAAALSGLAVLLMGGVNAADTLDVLIVPALFLLTRQRSVRRRSLMGWWVVCVGLATSWWLIPLVFLSKYGFNFLPYTEQAVTTTSTMSAAAALQGTGDWAAYLNFTGLTWNQAGLTLTTFPLALFGSAFLAGVGLFGLARRDLHERRFLLLLVGLALILGITGYWGPFGGPFGGILRPLLNSTFQPFRNVWKFEPLLALALALGIAHALQIARLEISRISTYVGISVLAIIGLLSLASPYFAGRVMQDHSFSSVPSYWYKTADYLAKHAPRTTALVVPAAGHGFYTWGWTIDEPLEALAKSPWVDREIAPYSGAGSTRVIDAIDQGLRTALPQPGLAALLNRSGISYVVVQNDSQWQLSDSPSPSAVNSVLSGTGFSLAASFGPTVKTSTGNNPTLQVVNSGNQASFPAIQIFKVNGTDSPIASFPTSTAALVSGGPEADLQLFNQGVLKKDQAAILAGNWDGTTYTGPLWAVTDTLRRENVRFGLVNDNFSYTLSANQLVPTAPHEPDGARPPSQMLPFSGVKHQTVSQFVGATSVDASSYGSWLFSLPEYNPANVFDNDSSTGWSSGSPYGSVGEWIQIKFLKPRDLHGTHIELLASSGRPIATEVRVSTNRGSVLSQLTPSSERQPLAVPAGTANWLRVTFVKVRGEGRGGENAGIKKISIPGLAVQPYLKPPQEAIGDGAKRTTFSFQTAQVDPTAVLRDAPEPVLARTFSTSKPTAMTVTGTAVPKKGSALDGMLGSSALNVTASSTFDDLPTLRAQNLFDQNISTEWIASSRDATLKLSWPQPLSLNKLTIVFAQSGIAAKPQEILLKSPAGDRLLHVRTKGGASIVSFPALTTDQLQVTFPKVERSHTLDALGQPSQSPVGLAELEFPELRRYQIFPPDSASLFVEPCGTGPAITIDGQTYQTALSGTYGELLNLQPVQLSGCTSPVLAAGAHYLLASRTPVPFAVAGISASSAGPTSPPVPVRPVSTLTWGSENRTVRIGKGSKSYLEIHQNYNVGWVATLNGEKLQTVVLDGWQQGYVVPAGSGGVVQMTFQPESLYLAGLVVGALGAFLLLLLLGLSLTGTTRIGRWGTETAPVLPWNRAVTAWITIALSSIVLFSVGGPIVLAVPLLIAIGRRWPRTPPWIALVGMVLVGIVSAINPGNGAQSQIGSFGPWAQIASLVSVAAVLTPVIPMIGDKPGRAHARRSTRPEATPRDSPPGTAGQSGE